MDQSVSLARSTDACTLIRLCSHRCWPIRMVTGVRERILVRVYFGRAGKAIRRAGDVEMPQLISDPGLLFYVTLIYS